MPYNGRWSRALAFSILGALSGCGEGVQLIQENENSGVVRYRYQERQGSFLSSHRAEALEKAEKFCGGPIQISREGPTQSRKRMVEGIGGPDVIEEAWWGMRFHCQ